MATKSIIIKSFLLFILLFLPMSSVSYGQQLVSQGAWAVGLVRGLGWEAKGIPQQATVADYFDLLSGRNFITVNLGDYKTRLGVLPDTISYNVSVQHSGRYRLIAYVYGNPLMFTIDNQPTASSALSSGWNYEDMGEFILKRGVHKLSITIPQGGSINALYLSSYAENAIQPEGGWVANKALDYGTEARTMVMATDVAGQMPVRAQIPSAIRAGQNVREFIFQAPADPIVNFAMAFPGPSKGYVMVDSSIVLSYDTSAERTFQISLKAINLSQGQHTAYLKVLSGQMPDSFIINQHDDTPGACVPLMRTKGFLMGAANQYVPLNIAQASLGNIIAQVTKKTPAALSLEAMPVVKETELPSQRALRTYNESISPMRPFE
ncbi:MAG: hypothetical protein M1591_03925 [Deltaproteobacteria bacterium]|nr:hypothetical protein [Deltaproteobacteria bacterium]